LHDQVAAGKFREDLFYRLNVVPILLPRLRDRPDDIPPLIAHFQRRICARNGIPARQFSPEAMSAMRNYRWPGNVRELENTTERLEILSEGPVIMLSDLPDEIRNAAQSSPVASSGSVSNQVIESAHEILTPKPERTGTIDEMEKFAIEDALEFTRGNVRAAARRLGIGAATIYRKMKKYGIGSPAEADSNDPQDSE
jgi:DNA-binding NtrC family response regulator